MARRKKKTRTPLLARWRQRWQKAGAEVQHRWSRRFLYGGAGMIVLVAGLYGMLRLERAVLNAPLQQVPPKIRLVDVPADLEEIVATSLEPFENVPWSKPTLCTDIARALDEVAWVKAVVSVHRFPNHRIEVQCIYRKPVALIQMDDGLYLVDEDCVRLPGRYANDASIMLIQGVGVAAPPAGEAWAASDLRAGVELIRLLEKEPFADQITAIYVHNFNGRADPRAAHVELVTDRAGGRIIWGSAPGSEIEENTVAEKLDLLRSNYRTFGRADANRGVIDISIHPDRIVTPT